MRTIKRDIVGAVIISGDNKVILGAHSAEQGGVYSGLWVVPGGGIEKGEDELTALQREILEEVNIDISGYPAEKIRIGEGQSQKTLAETGETVLVDMTFHDYVIRINDQTSKELGSDPTEEFHKIEWFSPDKIDVNKTGPQTIKLLEHIKFI